MRLRIGAGLGRARSGNVQTTNQKFVYRRGVCEGLRAPSTAGVFI